MPEKPQAKLIHEAKNTAEFVAALKSDRLKIEVPRPNMKLLHVWRTGQPTRDAIEYHITFNTDKRELAKITYFNSFLKGVLIGNLKRKDVVPDFTDLGLAKLLFAIMAEDLANQDILLVTGDTHVTNLKSFNSRINARNVFTGEPFRHEPPRKSELSSEMEVLDTHLIKTE